MSSPADNKKLVYSQDTVYARGETTMRLLLLAVTLLYAEFSASACPTTFADDGAWLTSEPEWSADVVFVLATISVSNDESSAVDFSALTAADTLQSWVNLPVGGDPYATPVHDITDADYIFKNSPAGNVYGVDDLISWQVAIDISGAPEGYRNTLSLRPEEGGVYGQFSFTLRSSEIFCSSGEPFFTTIASAEAGIDEILLTVEAEQGTANITSYDAVCEDTSGTTTSASSGVASITVTGLETGEDYSCIVTATNSVGTSAESEPTGTLTPSVQGLPSWLLYEASTP